MGRTHNLILYCLSVDPIVCVCVYVCFPGLTTAAVCVYPSRVADAVATLRAAGSPLPVASGGYQTFDL